MGIRGKLLLLALGIAVPLVLVGALDLRSMWRLSRAQLDDSVKQQVQLASVAMERWLDDQKKALDAIASLAGDKDTRSPAISENLENVMQTRPFWLDLRITNTAGTTMISHPARQEVLPEALTDYLVSEMRERNSWSVVTDRTMGEARQVVILAVPTQQGGAVIARIDAAAINDLFDKIELSPQVVITVLDSDGRVLYRRRGSEAPSEADVGWAPLPSALGSQRTNVVELTSPIDGVKRVYGVAHIRDTGLIAMIGIPSSTLYEPARRRLNRYVLTGVLALLLAIGAALIIERSIVLPVRRLRAAAQRFGAGDLAARAPSKAAGEIGDLGTAFNTMASQIKEREERLTELDELKSDFVSNVSHELRTPLTTIKLLAHLLQQPQLDEAEEREYLKIIGHECDRQIEFVGKLLDVSRIESGDYKLSGSRVRADELIDSCVEVEKYRAKSSGLELTSNVTRELPPFQGDFEALRRVIRGLIDNAIKHTPTGGQIDVSAGLTENQMVVVSVADTGKGISPADLPHVFEKFYRADSKTAEADPDQVSPETSTVGVGLGLYLAQHIVSHLGGEIIVESKLGAGTTFKVLLPRWTATGDEARHEEDIDVEATVGS